MLRSLLTLTLASLALCHSWAYSFLDNGIYYTVSNGTATVSPAPGEDRTHYSGHLDIPATVAYEGETYPVTIIDWEAFALCKSLQSVSLPTSIELLGSMAFAATGITEITLPSGVTAFGEWVFNSCNSLTTVTIQGSVTEMGQEAFSDCTLLS